MLPTAYFTMFYLQGPAPAPPSWQFDAVSALIGAVVALVLIGLIYRFRNALRQSWEAIVTPLAQSLQRLEASAEDRYRELVTIRARSLIVPARAVSLDAVFIEPRLLAPPPLPQSVSEIDTLPVNPQVLPLRRILGKHPQLAILGTPGAGKTMLLAYVAFACARTVEAKVTLRLAQERLPLYIPLSTVGWDEPDGENGDEEGEEGRADKQEGSGTDRLISAAVTAVEGSKGMMKILRQRLEAGQAIVLVDGWEELLPQQRQRAVAWLSELIGAMPGNLWLVSAGPRGYGPLTEAGFVPLKLAAWDAGQVEPFARQWMEAYVPADTDDDDKESIAALRQLVAALRLAARAGVSPLALALQAFVYLSDGKTPAKQAPLFDQALNLLLRPKKGKKEEDPWLLATCRAALEQIALDLQQEERATVGREEIEAAVESALPLSEELPARAATRVFRALTGEQGLLRPVGADRYVFAHSLWQAYLAARRLVVVDPASLVERLDDPRWAEVLRFYAEVGDMRPLVAAWLRHPDDMFRTRLRTLSSWIKAAPEDADWRDGAMAVLARSFLQPRHPAQVSQGLAEALAATGVPGVTYLFKQALQHPDAGMRRAAVMGLTLTGTAGESDLPALEAALADKDPTVREATVRGLAHLGIDAATRWLARILLEEDETLSLVAAEALAQCGGEGINLLHEAIESEDAMARRAAVFGLAQIEARDLLERVALEDEQWVVRSAATMALDELAEQEKTFGVNPPLEIEQLPWLISWAASKGEGVGLGDAARRMIVRALNEGDAPTRLAAARVLAQAGRPDDVESLRKTLTSSDLNGVNAALKALAEISERYELRIE